MKILAIRGRNLASLAGEFVVDFSREPLLNAGLFAISGPTGAGKSTLLDALCLALYGETPRLMQAAGEKIPDVHDEQITPSDPRNLLRRGCGEGYAEVDFVGIDGIAYRTRWTARRARGRGDGKLQQVEYQLSRLTDLQPVGGTKKSEVLPAIAKLIGLSFAQFTRAVLLAQNDFATFLKADDNARAELLQTLTGSERFERLSVRVYERFVMERQALDALNQQLAGAPPLHDAARAELETALTQAQAAAAAHEQDKLKMEAALRWHQQLAQLETNIVQAQGGLELARHAQQLAADRRSQLARITAVEPVRPLQVECLRLELDATNTVQAQQTLEVERLAAEQAAMRAETTLTQVRKQLSQIDQTLKQQQPEIDAAKKLDTEIALLAPQAQTAKQAFETANKEVGAQQQLQQTLIQQQTQTDKVLTETRAWLAAHLQHASLADNWTHAEYLLLDAEKAATTKHAGEAERVQLQQTEQFARTDADQKSASLNACVTAREQANAAAEAASERCARIDPEALAQQRLAAETQRNRLQQGQTCWTQWQERQREHTATEQEAAALRLAQQTGTAALALLTEQRPGLAGQLQQAERALQRLQTACNQDVAALRAALGNAEACPVCGATDHPYAESDAAHRLHQLYKTQQTEHDALRARLEALIKDEAALNATLKEQDKQLKAFDTRLLELKRRLAEAASLWQSAAESNELVPYTSTDTAAQLSERIGANASALQKLTEQETALRADQKARDAALAALTQAQSEEQLAREASLKAHESWSLAVQAVQAVQQRIEHASNSLAARLDELDGVLSGVDWRSDWQHAPAAFRLARQADATSWQQQQKAQEAQAGQLAELNSQISATASVLTKLDEHAARLRAAATEKAAELQAKQHARSLLLGGKPVSLLEAEQVRCLEAAQTAVTAQERITHDARTRATQAATACELAGKRLVELHRQVEQTEAARNNWLSAFNVESDAPLDLAELLALLQVDPQWLSAERNALAGLDQAIKDATLILQERKTRRGAHLVNQPCNESAASLEARLVKFLPLLTQEKTAATEMQLLLRQDDERRQQAAGLIEQLRKQDARLEIWARLNEMIGSANGSKFRRIAQQYTLDVLLGYANRHLADLSRRYLLQRQPDTLTLLVVDLDMGDERRSVHSLSGGESFLVSLALALGLASLSSHSVKVESLFIDEGFGSLDAETLNMAMDALDKLQTQGRKVGVISHVHEMAERIGVQIQVQQQFGGQSRLAVLG